MNRREFIQALIGIPLMPLLAAEAGSAGLWHGTAGEVMCYEWNGEDWVPVNPRPITPDFTVTHLHKGYYYVTAVDWKKKCVTYSYC